MKALLPRSLAITGCIALSACSLFGGKGNSGDYRTPGAAERPQKSLAVPPDLVTPSRDPRFAVPDSSKGSTTFSTYQQERQGTAQSGPAAAAAAVDETLLPSTGKIHMERAGSQRWLVVPGTPEKVWADLKTFWQDNGFIIKVDSPDVGVMETEWAENQTKLPFEGVRGYLSKALNFFYSTGQMDKFRARIERSAQPGMVEVYISHRGMEEVFAGQDTTRWQPRAVDPDLEAQMIRRFALRFGVDEKAAKAIVADATPAKAGEPAVAAHAFLMDGGQRLEVDGALDRVWRQVGVALDRVGVVVEDRDRGANTYYVRYLNTKEDPKAGKSWLSSLAFWRKAEIGTDQFRITLAAKGGVTSVQVASKDGRPAPEEANREILKLLLDELK